MQPSRFFRFREERGWNGAQPIVGFASKNIVRALFSLEEMSALFGGYLEYEDTSSGERYLGVWGDRKVGRFLRLLREKGLVKSVEMPGPNQFRQRHRASKN